LTFDLNLNVNATVVIDVDGRANVRDSDHG